MKRVLMLAGDHTEDYEVMVPYQALLMAGWRWMCGLPGQDCGRHNKDSDS